MLAVQTSSFQFSESVITTPGATAADAPPLGATCSPWACNSALSACSIRATSSGFREDALRISYCTFSRAGNAARILRANSFAESSSVAERAAAGIPIKMKRNSAARRESLDRSAGIIGALRLDSQSTRKNRARRAGLQEMIAQRARRAGGCGLGFALTVSGIGRPLAPAFGGIDFLP